MRDEGLWSAANAASYRLRTTQNDHDGTIAPNRLAQIHAITACHQVWQADVTNLPTRTGWLYLAVVICLQKRRARQGLSLAP